MGKSFPTPLFFIWGLQQFFLSEDSGRGVAGRGVSVGTGLSASAGFSRLTLGRACSHEHLSRDDVSEMQQERLRERVYGSSLGSMVSEQQSMYYGMEWVPHTELNIASNVKSFSLLQTGQ